MSKDDTIQPEEMAGRELGGCEILNLIGQGAMGDVYRARQLSLRRIVALKVLARELSRNTDLIQRFQREAHAVARLNHQNIASVFDFGSSGDIHFIVMEYVDGKSLDDILKEAGRLAPGRALDYMMQAAAGIAHAHAAGILHRDIKPGNLLVSNSGVLKVLDFGLAKTQFETSSSELTAMGTMMGTPNYMSPEQCAGEPISPASDIYCLGGTFYRMLTGQTCFQGDNPIAIMLKHKSEHPLPLFLLRPDVPSGFSEVIMKMLAKKPEERYANAAAVLAELQRVKEGASPVAAQSKFGILPVHPGYQDDLHLIRGLFQFKMATPEQITEALQLQDQLQEVGMTESLSHILLKKQYVTEENIRFLSDAISRSRRQVIDEAFLSEAREQNLLSEERIDWVRRRLKELDKEGRPSSACLLITSRQYMTQASSESILKKNFETEQAREEKALQDTAARLGLVKPEDFEAAMAKYRATEEKGTFQRADQVLVQQQVLGPPGVRQIFRARLQTVLGGPATSIITPTAELGTAKSAAPLKVPRGAAAAAAASPVKRGGTILPDLSSMKMETSAKCPHCKKDIPKASIFCPFCNHRLPKPAPRAQPQGKPGAPGAGPKPQARTAQPSPVPRSQPTLEASPATSEQERSKTILPDLWVLKLPGGEMSRPLSMEDIVRLIAGKKILPETPMQTPFSQGKWVRAGRVKELARVFGACHACRKPVQAHHRGCPHCGAEF